MKKSFIILSLFFFFLCSCLFGEAPDHFRFVILGDRTGGRIDPIYECIVENSLAHNADFYITVGDQIDGGVSRTDSIHKQWDGYLSIIEPVPVPVFLVPGNHDIWSPLSETIWYQKTGRNPNYSFTHRHVHFTVLDTSRWESGETLPETTITWLKEDLAKNKTAPLTIVFYHKPFWYTTLRFEKKDMLHDICREYGVDAVFNGHLHIYHAAEYDGIRYTIVGSSGGSLKEYGSSRDNFFHYAVVDIEGNEIKVTIIPI
ncbi:MAG: metallophosphoesterase [Spirochaetales bacterium]|nr:metallophosphoesterase [Spirochaetales bacterium]